MSRSDIDVRIGIDVDPFISETEKVEGVLVRLGLRRALHIAYANNYVPVRYVLSGSLWRALGGIGDPSVARLYGIPIEVAGEAERGFGLVVRPPVR